MLSLPTVLDVVVPAARVAPYRPVAPLLLFALLPPRPPPLYHQLNKHPPLLPPPSFAPRKENLSFPYMLHDEPGKASVGRVDVSAESGEMGGEMGGIDLFNVDGQAHVAEGYPGNSSRGGKDGLFGCGAGNVFWGCLRGFFCFRFVSRRWSRGGRGRVDFFWPSWTPCRVGLSCHRNSARTPRLNMYGWMVLTAVFVSTTKLRNAQQCALTSSAFTALATLRKNEAAET